MSDALLGLTEVTAASNARIASIVQSYLVQSAKILPNLTDYSFLVQKGDKSVALPRSGGFTVAQKTENLAIDAQTVTYASDAIVFGEPYAAQMLIEDTANQQAAMDLVSDVLLKAGKDMALKLDTVAIAAMVAGASTTGPDHQLVFVDTSTDVIAKADVLAARKLLSDQNIDPTECFIGIGPEKEAEILNIVDFITASTYGAGAPLASGQIGSIYGSRVILHTGFADRMVMWHPSSVGHAFAYNVKVESIRDLANLANRYSLSASWACKVLDAGKRLVHTDSTN
jgi:hypothetical protein